MPKLFSTFTTRHYYLKLRLNTNCYMSRPWIWYGGINSSETSFITYCWLFRCFWFCWWTLFLSSFWTCGWRSWAIHCFAFLFYITLIPEENKPINQLQKLLYRPDEVVKKTQKWQWVIGHVGLCETVVTWCVIHLSSTYQVYSVPVSCKYINFFCIHYARYIHGHFHGLRAK